MRESRTSGSVEGVMGNHDSYSDPSKKEGEETIWSAFEHDYPGKDSRIRANP